MRIIIYKWFIMRCNFVNVSGGSDNNVDKNGEKYGVYSYVGKLSFYSKFIVTLLEIR